MIQVSLFQTLPCTNLGPKANLDLKNLGILGVYLDFLLSVSNPVLLDLMYLWLAPLGELDYNLHKSNGTYFTDLDIARGHHIYCLFRVGVNEYGSRNSSRLSTDSTGSTKPPPTGHFIMALGGVTCTLERELKPYRKYEIWTSVLSWDEKWIYVISHIVKPDSANPTAYSDQPWKKTGTGDHHSFGKLTVSEAKASSDPARESAKFAQPSSSASTSSTVHPGIYAVSIAKHAFKQGRLTIPPTVFLQACDFLPASPAVSSDYVADAPTPTLDAPFSSSVDFDTSVPNFRRATVPSKENVVSSDVGGDGLWQALEARRMQHLGLAKHTAGLDEGLGLFTGDEVVGFARYWNKIS